MTDYITTDDIAFNAEMKERLTALEFQLEQDRDGWIRMEGGTAQAEFSREAIRTITERARIFYVKNPLIGRAVDIATYYVFGRGVQIGATDDDIKEVVNAFIKDENNLAELTSAQARKARDKELRVDGNLFFALFVNPLTGNVRVGTVPLDEIDSVIRDPQNRKKTRYYKRVWQYEELNEATGAIALKNAIRYVRDFRYNPPVDRSMIGDIAVERDFVIYHVKTGGFADWAFGISETYRSQDWAKAYVGFLGDYVKIIKALARFAWRKKTGASAAAVTAAKTKLTTTLNANNPIESNPSSIAGGVMIEGGPNEQLDPIKTANATTAASEGKEIRLMAGIGMGLPDHIASGDMAQGTLATAKSLDRPTEFQFVDRQELWISILQTIIGYALYHAVVAPSGALRNVGTPIENEYHEMVVDWGETDPTIMVDFPPIIEQDQVQAMEALIKGVTLDGKTPSLINDMKLIARQAMVILGWDDVDAIVERLYPGEYVPQIDDPALAKVNESLRSLIEVLRANDTH